MWEILQEKVCRLTSRHAGSRHHRGRRVSGDCHTVWVKPPWNFLTFFPKRLGIFTPHFTWLLPVHVPIYAGLQIFIQLAATLTGASIPQQPWRYSPHSHVLPPLFVQPPPPQTIFGHCIPYAILCNFMRVFSEFWKLSVRDNDPQKTKNRL